MLTDKVAEVLEECKQEIQDNLRAKGINASGRTSDSLRVVVYDGGVKLIASEGRVAPLATLEVGRAGGAIPQNFASIIDEWKADKGLQHLPTWGIITNIRKFGTIRHQPDKHEDVYSSATRDVRARLRQVIMAEVRDQILTHNI